MNSPISIVKNDKILDNKFTTNIMIQKHVILGIIHNSNNEILVTQRLDPEIPDAHFKWDLVGGKREEDETDEQTLVRECMEEVNCAVKVLSKLDTEVSRDWNSTDDIVRVTLSCYICELLSESPNPTLDRKIKQYKWMPLSEALELDLLPTTRQFLESINQ